MRTVFTGDYTREEAMIHPSDFIRPVEGFPRICIATYSKKIIDRYAALPNVTRIGRLNSANGEKPIYKMHYEGREIAFYLAMVGAPSSVAEMEEVIEMGGRHFVYFGSCGILDEEKVRGRIIVPSGAVRDEGTSYHYQAAAPEIYPDADITKYLTDTLRYLNIPFVTGKVWTTDAIYRETKKALAERKSAGCLGVEMEYAALLAAARFRGVSLLQFFYGADSLDGGQWEVGDLLDHGLTGADRYMQLALACGSYGEKEE